MRVSVCDSVGSGRGIEGQLAADVLVGSLRVSDQSQSAFVVTASPPAACAYCMYSLVAVQSESEGAPCRKYARAFGPLSPSRVRVRVRVLVCLCGRRAAHNERAGRERGGARVGKAREGTSAPGYRGREQGCACARRVCVCARAQLPPILLPPSAAWDAVCLSLAGGRASTGGVCKRWCRTGTAAYVPMRTNARQPGGRNESVGGPLHQAHQQPEGRVSAGVTEDRSSSMVSPPAECSLLC